MYTHVSMQNTFNLLKIEEWVNMRNKQEIILNSQVIWKKEPNQIYIDGK